MTGMDVFESIADRRIRAAREAGLFDNLPGAGKPIPDLGRERPAGWWVDRLVRRERSMQKAEDLERTIRTSMPAIWRMANEADVRDALRQLNERIDAYNRVTTLERRQALVENELVEQWRRLGAWRAGRR
jgi:hypothetical protein